MSSDYWSAVALPFERGSAGQDIQMAEAVGRRAAVSKFHGNIRPEAEPLLIFFLSIETKNNSKYKYVLH